jgi:hypothetical protein
VWPARGGVASAGSLRRATLPGRAPEQPSSRLSDSEAGAGPVPGHGPVISRTASMRALAPPPRRWRRPPATRPAPARHLPRRRPPPGPSRFQTLAPRAPPGRWRTARSPPAARAIRPLVNPFDHWSIHLTTGQSRWRTGRSPPATATPWTTSRTGSCPPPTPTPTRPRPPAPARPRRRGGPRRARGAAAPRPRPPPRPPSHCPARPG